MRNLIEYFVKALVDSPEEASVESFVDGDTETFEIHVAQPDRGRIIGRQGRNIAALRNLARAVPSEGVRRTGVEVVD